MLRRLVAVSMLTLGLGIGSTSVGAQDYPTQAVRFVIPFAPGGGADVHGRLTAELLSQRLGQPVIVESKPGAGGAIGTDFVAKSRPDGYTLVYASTDVLSVGPAVKPTMPYKVPDDFAFIGRTLDFSYIVTVNPKLPVNSLAELIAYAKANPGKLRYGSAGVGSAPHMATELISKAAGIEMTHVPFGGAGPAITAMIGGHIDMVIAAPTVKNFTDAGSVRAIASTGKSRDPNFPNVSTLAESGLPNVVVGIWWGILAPAGTPEPALARLRKEVAELTNDPQSVERLKKVGYEWSYLDQAAFKEFVLKDLAQWKSIAQSANIKVD